MDRRNDPQNCECGQVMRRDKASELRGTIPPAPQVVPAPPPEKSMRERVLSGEFNLYKEWHEKGGPKMLE